ncbi:hypothetical protein [Novosphingobium pokkalii]|uniref:hypothetical protein n=1 Tax=Novosphingobium pokkalii TaxID=1770194 RepID=UPI00174B834D|nr:hypothetical protein [Novosphingobium pokkalii]GHC99885.1 hypothetical protein GCM10019060_32980 [Novosphingobium pokkalii]
MTDTNDTEVTTAQAFEAVRHELSLLHNAVANLTAARERIPDHTAALDGIDRSLGNVRARLAAIEQAPAVSLTPAEMTKQINLAAQTVRTEDSPGAIARSLPASWHVPEWMAARTMNMDQRAAGERLIATARGLERP